MVEVLVTGHGAFASGLVSAAKLIAGSLAEVHAVDFDPSKDVETLRNNIKEVIEDIKPQEVIVLTDLLGGTPFNVASVIKEEKPEIAINVLAGTNLAMVLEAVFARSSSLEDLVKQVKAAGIAGIAELGQDDDTEDDVEDGI